MKIVSKMFFFFRYYSGPETDDDKVDGCSVDYDDANCFLDTW